MDKEPTTERTDAWCYQCERPKDSACDACGRTVCVVCDGAYCWECSERMEKGDDHA
jgi:hypothetical protein